MIRRTKHRLIPYFQEFVTYNSKDIHVFEDTAGWAVTAETEVTINMLKERGYNVTVGESSKGIKNSLIYYPTMYHFKGDLHQVHWSNRLVTTWYHGRHDKSDNPEFKRRFDFMKIHHCRLYALHVTHREFEDYVLKTGINKHKIYNIPIGVDLKVFSPKSVTTKSIMRERLGIPDNARVIGSFQHDDMNWEPGNKPKLIKGPDILLMALGYIKQGVKNLHVLLTGAERSYVRKGLEQMGIPYTHRFLKDPKDVADYYHAIDLYLVTSREEGGPKAVLECMATHTPIISSKVGQAPEMLVDGHSGFLTDVGDYERTAKFAIRILNGEIDTSLMTLKASTVIKNYDYNFLSNRFLRLFRY